MVAESARTQQNEPRLVILKRIGKTPFKATCSKCRVKFFTPQDLLIHPRSAELYLLDEFAAHKMQGTFCRLIEHEMCGAAQALLRPLESMRWPRDLLEFAQATFPDSDSVKRAKRFAYLKLMEKNQNTDPFKFIMYSAKIGEQTPQTNAQDAK